MTVDVSIGCELDAVDHRGNGSSNSELKNEIPTV